MVTLRAESLRCRVWWGRTGGEGDDGGDPWGTLGRAAPLEGLVAGCCVCMWKWGCWPGCLPACGARGSAPLCHDRGWQGWNGAACGQSQMCVRGTLACKLQGSCPQNAWRALISCYALLQGSWHASFRGSCGALALPGAALSWLAGCPSMSSTRAWQRAACAWLMMPVTMPQSQ